MELYLTAFYLVAALPGGQGIVKTLIETAGRNITLDTGVTGLHDNSHIIWSYGSEYHLLLNFDDGKLVWRESQRFHLDKNTGSLTIQNLSIDDGGLYRGQIINGNGSTHDFNLTIVEPAPNQPPAGGSNNLTGEQKTNLAVGLSVGGLVALVITGLIVYAVCYKKEKCCSSDVGV